MVGEDGNRVDYLQFLPQATIRTGWVQGIGVKGSEWGNIVQVKVFFLQKLGILYFYSVSQLGMNIFCSAEGTFLRFSLVQCRRQKVSMENKQSGWQLGTHDKLLLGYGEHKGALSSNSQLSSSFMNTRTHRVLYSDSCSSTMVHDFWRISEQNFICHFCYLEDTGTR